MNASALQAEIHSIARHESGHAICALALGHGVRLVKMQLVGNAVLGMTYPQFKPGVRRGELVAVYIAGVEASNAYSHLQLPSPILIKLGASEPKSPRSKRLQQSVDRFQFGQMGAQSGSDYDGDLGVISSILGDVKDTARRERIFSAGHDLCRAALRHNERPLQRIATYLVVNGALSGAPLDAFARQVVHIDAATGAVKR